MPGRSLQQIARIAAETLPSYSYDNYYCIVHAGICSLTIRTAVGHPTSLRYPLIERENKVREILQTINELKITFRNRINICTIAPASLIKFFVTRHPTVPLPRGLDKEQDALIEDIFFINSIIKQLNSDWGNPNINLSGRLFSHSKKKLRKSRKRSHKRVTKLKECHLVDGIHFSDEIRDICFRLITNTAAAELIKLYTPPSPLTQESTTSDSQDDL